MQVKLEKANANNFFCCRKIGQRSLRLNAYHLNWDHMKVKWNIRFPTQQRVPATLMTPVWNRVCSNADTVSASQCKQVFSDSLYLVPLYPLGLIRPCFLCKHQNSSGGRGLLSSLRVKESGALGLWSLLQHQSPKSVSHAFRSGPESFVASK